MLDKEITIRNMLLMALLMAFIGNAIGYWVLGPVPLYDETTMLIALATCVILKVALIKSDEVTFPMAAMLTVFFLIFVFPRVLGFLYLPDISHLPLSVTLGAKEINFGFAYFAIGMMALNAGFFLARKLFLNLSNNKEQVENSHAKVYPLHHLMIAFTILCMTQLYVAIWLGDSVLGDIYYGARNKFVGVLSVLFNNYQALLVSVVALLISRNRGQKIAVSFSLFLGAFLGVTVLLGARSGGLNVLLLVLAAMLSIYGNFRESLKNYLYFLLVVAVLSTISFKIGTNIRTSMIYARDHSTIYARDHSTIYARDQSTIYMRDQSTIYTRDQSAPTTAYINSVNGFDAALSRLGAAFDTEVLTLALPADQEMLSQNMTLSYALKSSVNVIVPGVIYNDAQTNTALLWPFIYKLRDKNLLQKGYYESFLWTAWGGVYAMFGWLAGIIVLLIFGFILQAMFMLTNKLKEWRPYLSTWLLLNTFSFYTNMGLDDWMVGLQKTFFSLCLVLLVLEIIGRSDRWYTRSKAFMR